MTFDYDTATLKASWGVYAIVRKQTGRMYIGHTADSFLMRWKTHWFALRAGKHINAGLQWDWLFFGETAFEFRILEAYTERLNWRQGKTAPWAQHREAVCIAQSRNLYNEMIPAACVLSGEQAKKWSKLLWDIYYTPDETD